MNRAMSWDPRKSVRKDVYRSPLEERLKEKNGWNDTTLAQIAWKDFGKVCAKQSVVTRVKSMKRWHGTLATLSQLQKMFPEKYDNVTCPCCKRHQETNDHLWACPNEEMDLIVTNGLLELEEKVENPDSGFQGLDARDP
jgi:hypothetical protein